MTETEDTHGPLLARIQPDKASKLLNAAQVGEWAFRVKKMSKKAPKRPISPANEPFPTPSNDGQISQTKLVNTKSREQK